MDKVVGKKGEGGNGSGGHGSPTGMQTGDGRQDQGEDPG